MLHEKEKIRLSLCLLRDELTELFSTQEEQMEHHQGWGHIHTCDWVHLEYLQYHWCSLGTMRQKGSPCPRSKLSPSSSSCIILLPFLGADNK